MFTLHLKAFQQISFCFISNQHEMLVDFLYIIYPHQLIKHFISFFQSWCFIFMYMLDQNPILQLFKWWFQYRLGPKKICSQLCIFVYTCVCFSLFYPQFIFVMIFICSSEVFGQYIVSMKFVKTFAIRLLSILLRSLVIRIFRC